MATFENLSKQWSDSLLSGKSKPVSGNNTTNFAKINGFNYGTGNFDNSNFSTNSKFNDNTNKLLTGNNTLNPTNSNLSNNAPNYDALLAQYENAYKQSQSQQDADNIDRLKINNWLLRNGYDLNDINADNMGADEYSKIWDDLKDTDKRNEWMSVENQFALRRKFRAMGEVTHEFGNNMNNIQKQVYDLRNQFLPPISPYNHQEISPEEYQKQRQQRWGNLPPVSSSAYDKHSNPNGYPQSSDPYTQYAKQVSKGRKKLIGGAGGMGVEV